MGRGLDIVAPARLGRSFRWLLASSWTSMLGDGLAIAAAPLLVASLTHDRFLVSLAALSQWLPPLVLGLWAGALTDRLDRRRIVIAVDLARAGLIGLLAVLVAVGPPRVGVVLLVLTMVRATEVFSDNAATTVTPMLVAADDLAIANARVMTGFVTINQLLGPPIGAALFSLGAAVPFVGQGVLVAAAVALISRVQLPRPPGGEPRSVRVRDDIREGFVWTLRHPAVRTLVLTILIFNVTFGAAWSVLVLYAAERLGLGSVGFGLITTTIAGGGVLGTLCYGWLTRRVSLGNLMRAGLIVETLTHLALALATSPYVAMPVFFVFGAHAFVWGTTSMTVRQRAVPTGLQGRVASVHALGVFGGLVVGAAIGGVIAQRYGVTAPFWFAFVGSGIFVVLIWGQLRHLALGEHAPVPSPG